MTHHRTDIDRLEAEAATIIREAVQAAYNNVAILFSGGKDSAVVHHIAKKALNGVDVTKIHLVNIDTGHNFPEVSQYILDVASASPFKHVPYSVEDDLASGAVTLQPGQSRNAAQSVTLRRAINDGYVTLIGGARRDEEKARAKERIFSIRKAGGGWDPTNQRPELLGIYNPYFSIGGRPQRGDNFRVFPISNWTELDVWRYIRQEHIVLPSLYFAHERYVIRRQSRLVPLVRGINEQRPGEIVELAKVRFRTVGDMTCTCPVRSTAETVSDVIAETALATISERGATRADDAASEASMELRKKQGYF